MTCHDVIDVLAEYLDQVLPPEIVADLERHLAGCDPCQAYLATYRRTRALGAQAARLEMPDEMKARLREFLLARLR